MSKTFQAASRFGRTLTNGKAKLWEKVAPSEAVMETLEILMDLDQMTLLLNSMEESRHGQLVACQDAFADL